MRDAIAAALGVRITRPSPIYAPTQNRDVVVVRLSVCLSVCLSLCLSQEDGLPAQRISVACATLYRGKKTDTAADMQFM
eukprot:COSAG03_NODE_12183_length_557_cov_11.128049_2_plen_78_part_01